jgi:ACS family hexuronate transporter-like MFS transporter
MGAPLVAVYLLADVGSVAGGWLSSSLLKRGFTANRARKTAMLVCAVAVTGVMFVPFTQGNLWVTVAIIDLKERANKRR